MIYEDFLASIYNLVAENVDINNNIIRKHTKKLNKLGEFSFPRHISTFLPCSKKPEEVIQLLLEQSKQWPLIISKCELLDNSVHIFIDRTSTFAKGIGRALHDKDTYGSFKTTSSGKISIETDVQSSEVSEINLSQLRVLLLSEVTANLLEFCSCSEENATVYIYSKPDKNLKGVILCGHVSHTKGYALTAEQFYKKRTIDMRLMAEHKYGLRITASAGWQKIFEKLGQAAVIIELLQNKCNRNISINVDDPTSSSSKGASFVLYNCARLCTLFREFENRVAVRLYPPLPAFEDVDFALLSQPEEWELLFLHVLQFPRVVQSCVKGILDGRLNVHNLCGALSGMCAVFSVYYRRVRILTEPRKHLFGVLHARIYLLKAFEQVLHNGLRLLNIEPVKQM